MVIFNKKNEVRPEKIDDVLVMADKYFAEHPNEIRHCGDTGAFYRYEDGYYKQINRAGIERHFVMKAEGEFEPINYYKQTKFRQFIWRYSLVSHVPYEEFNKGEILNLENGLLDIRSGEFREHSPDVYSTIRIPYKYDQGAKCPGWMGFLNSSLEGDKVRIKVLQEFMGYCLGRDNQLQKALFLLGEPGSGKGTIIRVIEQMVGQENCSALPLGNMGDETSVANLVNKLVNFDGDVSITAKDFEADFRRITGGDKLTAKTLYKDKFSFRPFCKLILAANELPHISDRTRAFFRRMLVVPFRVSFIGREDRELEGKLSGEISGILNWALEGRRRLYEQKDFTMSKDLSDIVEDIKRQNNPIELYFNECIGFHDDAWVLKKDLYNNYKDFCKEEGYHALSHSKFSRELIRWAGPRTRNAERAPNPSRKPMWPNIYIKGINEPVEAQEEWAD